jgi:hypothetical protein
MIKLLILIYELHIPERYLLSSAYQSTCNMCNIDLQLSKSDGLIEFERKYLTSSESVYSIRLSNIQQVGFSSTEQHALEHEFRNLILACNLVIQRTCITDKKVEYPTYELVREYKEPETKAKKIDNLTQVDIVEDTDTSEKVHTVVIILLKTSMKD